MKNFWNYIGKALSENAGESSKRLNGTIGFILIQIILLFAVLYEYITLDTISITISKLVELDLWVSVGLLGLGQIVEGLKTKLIK